MNLLVKILVIFGSGASIFSLEEAAWNAEVEEYLRQSLEASSTATGCL